MSSSSRTSDDRGNSSSTDEGEMEVDPATNSDRKKNIVKALYEKQDDDFDIQRERERKVERGKQSEKGIHGLALVMIRYYTYTICKTRLYTAAAAAAAAERCRRGLLYPSSISISLYVPTYLPCLYIL